MGFTDVLLLAIRWLHNLSAVAWVGGGIFYLLVLRPSMASSAEGSGSASRVIGEQFRHLVNTAVAVLLVTGAILAVSRLTADYVDTPYIVVLVIKIVLALYMFYLVRFLRRRTYPDEAEGKYRRVIALFTSATTVLVLGVIVFLLSDILAELVEQALE